MDDPALVEDHLARTGLCAVTVTGSSMRPLLRDGDVLLLERAGTPRFGELVAVLTGSRLIVHRFLGGRGPWLLKADGLSQIDRVEGRLLARVRVAWRGNRALPAVTGWSAAGAAALSLASLPIQRLLRR